MANDLSTLYEVEGSDDLVETPLALLSFRNGRKMCFSHCLFCSLTEMDSLFDYADCTKKASTTCLAVPSALLVVREWYYGNKEQSDRRTTKNCASQGALL